MTPLRAKQSVEAFHEQERGAPARRGEARPERADLEIGSPIPRFITLGYFHLSLRDSKAAVFPSRENGPGVQRYDLWVKTCPEGEG